MTQLMARQKGRASVSRTLLYKPLSPFKIVIRCRDARSRYPPDTALKSDMLRHDDFRGDDLLVSFNGCGTILGGPACEELFWTYHNTSLLTMTVP